MTASHEFDDHAAVVERSRAVLGELERAADLVAAAIAAGRVCFAAGNGGSAADAQHFVAELVGHFDGPRRALPAMSLGTDPAVLTSVANDVGFEQVFARQVDALARPGDVLLAISTSGRSANVLAAAGSMRRLGGQVVALTGGDGGELAAHADVVVAVPSSDTQRIQEVHGLLLHVLVSEVQRRLGVGS